MTTTNRTLPTGLPLAAAPRLPVRSYERGFDWTYQVPPREPVRELVPVVLDGLWLNTGDQGNGLCAVVENLEGWLDSPPLDGNDVARVISDGAAWGPKVLGPRIITITGAATGPRDELGRFRDDLATRAASRVPVQLAVGDWDLKRVLTADVRAGTELYRHRTLGSSGFRYQLSLTAADPALYLGTWQTATLSNITEDTTGRDYPREYPWAYASPYISNQTTLRNDGNYPAPVHALYTGDLSESALTDGRGGILRVAALGTGVQILVATASLTAEAEGGQSRASFILPGSRQMWVPPRSTARWFLRAAGQGSIVLAWRSTWV
jgi:hypothetical protein